MALLLPARPNKLVYPGTKPGFNPAHPAAKKCVVACVPGASFNFINLVNGQPGSINNPSSSLLNKIFSNLGPAIGDVYNGGVNPGGFSDYITFPGQYDGGGQLTMAAIFFTGGDPGNTSYLMNDAAGGKNGIGTQISGGGAIFDYLLNGAGGSGGSPISINYSNIPYFGALSNITTGSNSLSLVIKRLDTGAIFSTTTAGSALSAGDGSIYICSRGAARQWNGRIATAVYSNTYLNLQQLLQWAADPWSFWYPPSLDFADMLQAPQGTVTIVPMGVNAPYQPLQRVYRHIPFV